MKTADIKVGTDYAYFSHKYSVARQVTVLETRVSENQGYGYNRRTVKSGVRVQFVTGPQAGKEAVVSSRQIERPWDEQERLNENARLAREAAADSERKTAAHRANVARRLDDHLKAHGKGETIYPARVHNKVQKAALEAVGFEWVEDGPWKEGFVTRITDLDDLMRRGEVDLRDVEFLLADVEARA